MTDFQNKFVSDIKWYTENRGQYIHYKSTLGTKYKTYGSQKELEKQIEELITNHIIIKSTEKITYQGRYSTQVHLAIF